MDGWMDGKGGMNYDFAEFTKWSMGSLRRLLDECADKN
jgi:hypothetical protein